MQAFYLASGSPRRQMLLRQIGVTFTPLSVDVDERPLEGEDAESYVQRLALEKARAGLLLQPGGVVMGADTSVVIDGHILTKPIDRADAKAMLMRLSGRVHKVMTGVALVDQSRQEVRVSCSDVHFCSISESQCKDYWLTGEPHDKAGGYAIQGLGAIFVNKIEGSYSGIVGLPIETCMPLLQSFGISYWHRQV